MRKVIDGRTYNTSTSEILGTWENIQDQSDLSYCAETLYRNSKGSLFIHGQGGPKSRYAKEVGAASTIAGEQIIPLTLEAAKKWAEEYLTVEEYEEAFSAQEEAGPEKELANRQRVNLTVADEVIEGMRKLSAETGTPMSQMVDRAIMAMYGEKIAALHR